MTSVIQHVRGLHQAGALLYCWSSGGADYARRSADEVGLSECFLGFLPKPDRLLDDVPFQRWGVEEVHPLSVVGGG